MGVCSKCKQNTHFTVKDAQQICGRCGATTTIAILQTEDFKGIKIKRNYISEKKEKRVTQDKSSMKHIEENWGVYLEGFQRALRESIRQVKNKLDLNEQFEEKAKYYWFEYLKIFSEKRIGLVSFFTIPRQGSHGGEELGNRKRYESKYGLKTSLMDQIDQEELEDEFDEETSEDLQDADFVEKILRQKNTQDMQTQIMEENKDIQDFFAVFADEKRVQDEDRGFELLNNTSMKKESENNNTTNRSNLNQSSVLMNQETQNQKAELRGIVKSEMAKYNILEQQHQEQLDKLDQKRRKKRRMKGRINYIENEEECSRNYFNLVLDRSEDYVKCLYNGFRAAYIHMINLQSPLNSNPLKKIHALKQTSNGYSISREFIQAAIIQRNIPFAQNCDRIDIFHLIWAWDWAVFISTISQEQFTPKESIQHVYEYLDRINQLVGKQLKEHKAIQVDLAKRKQQLSKTNKMYEIKKKLVESQKARTAKKNNKNNQNIEDENPTNIKNRLRGSHHIKGSGYLSGSEHEDEDTFVNRNDGEFDFMNPESNTRNEQLHNKIQATPKLQAKGKMFSQMEYENLDLNPYSNTNIFGNLSLAENSRFAKSDEREDQEKGIEEVEFQFTRFQARRSLTLDEDQLLTLQVILQEILNEKDILIKRTSTPKNSVLNKKKTPKKKSQGQLTQNDNILPLEYNLIPTIIYVSLYSLGYTYSPQKISNWMKNGVLAYSQGIAPFLNKIISPKDYWITPHSIPSSTFIRSQARRFIVMTNHSVNVSKKRLFKESMQIISDFALPFDWSCMVYLITISIQKITEESEQTEETECFDCDLLVAGAFIVLLKMIYGLNDELFGVLLSAEILSDAKDELTDQQYSTLKTIVTMFQRTTFKKTTGFYQEVPSFKNVAMNIQKYLDREANQSRIELHSYSELIGVSIDSLSSLLQVFLESRKREMIIHKQNNPSKYVVNIQQSQKISQQAIQMQYDEIEDELAIIRFFKLQLNMIGDNSMQNQQFNCTRYEEFKQEREFSGLLEADIKFIDANVIRNGKSLAPPSFDYVVDKKYQTGYISQELQFIADKIAIYTGETTEKILGYLQKVESKLRKSVTKNTKKLQLSNSSSFYDIISDKIKQSSKRQVDNEFSQ